MVRDNAFTQMLGVVGETLEGLTTVIETCERLIDAGDLFLPPLGRSRALHVLRVERNRLMDLAAFGVTAVTQWETLGAYDYDFTLFD